MLVSMMILPVYYHEKFGFLVGCGHLASCAVEGAATYTHITHVHVSDLRLEPVRLGVRALIEPKYSLIRASARASIEPS